MVGRSDASQAVRRLRRSAAWGGILWLAWVVWSRPVPMGLAWGVALLLLGALVIVPLGLALALERDPSGEPRELWDSLSRMVLPCGIALAASFALNPGLLAGLLALPWLVATLASFVAGATRFLTRTERSPANWCFDCGLAYLAVGGLWAVLSRLGSRPLGFEPVIVLLTSMHFHYAGFALPILAGMALQSVVGANAKQGARNLSVTDASEGQKVSPQDAPWHGRMTAFGVCAGVPAVALGITVAQMTGFSWLEMLAAWLLAAAGLCVSMVYAKLATGGPPRARAGGLWGLCAVSLSFAMVFAALYGSRHAFSMKWLSIPWMRALHGTAVAIGFALAGMISWSFSQAAPEAVPEPAVGTPQAPPGQTE